MASTATFIRSLGAGPSSVGNFVHICQVTASDTSPFGIVLSVVESATLERIYRVKINYNSTGQGVWKRLVPIDATEPNTTWGVEVQSPNNVATFRIVRTVSDGERGRPLRSSARRRPSPAPEPPPRSPTLLQPEAVPPSPVSTTAHCSRRWPARSGLGRTTRSMI